MRTRLSRLCTARERGAAMFLIIITIMIVMIAGAFALDLSATATRGQQLQNAADSSALAGVQAYRDSINSRATTAVPYPVANATDEAAARTAVNDLLAQNGIIGITPDITFPDPLADTEIRVELVDASGGGRLLSGFTGNDGGVSRFATASFKSCSTLCTNEVAIPAPFTSVNAKGEGDGYKPIPVLDKFYALNHNKNTITCVDRVTQEACWCINKVTGGVCDGNTADSERSATRYAYSGSLPPVAAHPGNSKWNPEMPHAAVYESTIWWSTSDDSGHRLYCWEAQTDTPCSISYELSDDPRATSNQIGNTKDQNRGGGTVLVNDRIYAFTDDHMVHCFNPDTRAFCGRTASALGVARFPVAHPNDDNHGSSIDRIVANDGKIYSTLHIKTAVELDGPYDCSENLQDILGKRVIFRVADSPLSSSHPWVSGDTTNPNSDNRTIRTSGDGNDVKDRWTIADAGDGNYYVRSGVNGYYWDADGTGDRLELSSSAGDDDEWRFVWHDASRTFTIQNVLRSTWIERNGSQYETVSGASNATRFSVNHWQCEVSPAPPQGLPTLLPYAAGTWLHCFDTQTGAPCSTFTASRIHKDASRFSGRLFFFRSAAGLETGVCSTGFEHSVDFDEFEINCVGLDGSIAPSMDDVFNSDFKPAIVASLATYPAAWGDPHYNAQENRLFYPTHHSNGSDRLSRVLCWDFDLVNGWCTQVRGFFDTTSEGRVYIEDYGFHSEGNCVYGLGHKARFWAFKASDLGEQCTGSSTEALLKPCNCSTVYDWGTLHFNIDLSPYTSFEIVIRDRNDNPVWPKGWQEGQPGHSLFHDGLSIPLDDVPVDPVLKDDDRLTVRVEVENHQGFPVDPNGKGITQYFEVEFEQTPRLTG